MAVYHVSRYLYWYKLNDEYVFLLNLLTGGADLVDTASFEWLNHQTDCPELANFYLERYYIFKKPEEEEALRQRLIQIFTENNRATPSLNLCPTYACNLACTYCFEQNQDVAHQYKFMTRQQVRDAFDAFDEIRRPFGSKRHITFFGGEPFMNGTWDAVEEALIQAKARGYYFHAVTNGVNAPDFIPLFKQFPEQIRSFQITLDGPKSVHDTRRVNKGGKGSYDAVVRGIDALLDAGFEVHVQTILDKQNFETLGLLLESADFDRWSRHPRFQYSVGRTQYLYDELLLVNDPFAMTIQEFNRQLIPFIEQHPLRDRISDYSGELNPALSLHKFLMGKSPFLPNVFGCVAVYPGRYFFGQDGLIYPCSEVIGVRSAAVGTYEGGLRWNENYERWRKRSPLTHPKCSTCRFQFVCGGGCAVQSLAQVGVLEEVVCPPDQDILDRYLEDNAERLLTLFGVN